MSRYLLTRHVYENQFWDPFRTCTRERGVFTATQQAQLLVGALLLRVISKTKEAGILLFEKFKPSTLSTDGELLKFLTRTLN